MSPLSIVFTPMRRDQLEQQKNLKRIHTIIIRMRTDTLCALENAALSILPHLTSLAIIRQYIEQQQTPE